MYSDAPRKRGGEDILLPQQRVYLQYEYISDAVARRMSASLNILWLLLPLGIVVVVVKNQLNVEDFVLDGEQTNATLNTVVASICVAALAMVLITLLLRVLRLRFADHKWYRDQHRLVALRAALVSLILVKALNMLILNARALADVCSYSDSSGSVRRWIASVDEAVIVAVFGVLVVDVRSLRLVRPAKTHAPIFSWLVSKPVSFWTTPESAKQPQVATSAAFTEPRRGQDAAWPEHGRRERARHDGAQVAPLSLDPPRAGAGCSMQDVTPVSHEAGRVLEEAWEGVRHGIAGEHVAAAAHFDVVAEALHASLAGLPAWAVGSQVAERSVRVATPYTAPEARRSEAVYPLMNAAEAVLVWAWDVWAVLAITAGMAILHFARYRTSVFFAESVQSRWTDCTKSAACQCDADTVVCIEDPEFAEPSYAVLIVCWSWLGLLFFWELGTAMRALGKHLYTDHKQVHVLVDLQIRFGLLFVISKIYFDVLDMFVVSDSPVEDKFFFGYGVDPAVILNEPNATLAALEPYRQVAVDERRQHDLAICLSHIIRRYGNPAMLVTLTVLTILNLLLVFPLSSRARTPLLHWQAQTFVWRDSDMESAKRARNTMSGAPAMAQRLQQPMFSMERAVCLFFWATLAYKYSEIEAMEGTMNPNVEAALGEGGVQTAMRFYGLKKIRLFWERAADTKCMVAWGANAILLTFRGSVTSKNAQKDVEVSRVPMPGSERMGHGDPFWCFSRGTPMVHSGFQTSYESSHINVRVLGLVYSLLESHTVDRSTVTVYVTGHSLGGALAILCSLDIARSCGLRKDQVICYTYGAPRVGNHPFARYVNAMVPDSWRVINDQDVVTKVGKLWGLFKRSGHRVVVDRQGKLVVNPSFFEFILLQNRWRTSVKHHLPGFYMESLSAAIRTHMHLCQQPKERETMARWLASNPVVDRMVRLFCTPQPRDAPDAPGLESVTAKKAMKLLHIDDAHAIEPCEGPSGRPGPALLVLRPSEDSATPGADELSASAVMARPRAQLYHREPVEEAAIFVSQCRAPGTWDTLLGAPTLPVTSPDVSRADEARISAAAGVGAAPEAHRTVPVHSVFSDVQNQPSVPPGTAPAGGEGGAQSRPSGRLGRSRMLSSRLSSGARLLGSRTTTSRARGSMPSQPEFSDTGLPFADAFRKEVKARGQPRR